MIEVMIKKIFNLFFRGESSNDDQQGFGIGLSITKRIIDLHKGNIKVKSSINNKTKFTIHIPTYIE